MLSTPVILAFILYFSILGVIAVISHKSMKTSTDFIVGNRSLNFWVIALSAHASDMSAWLFMAFPAGIYMSGLPKIWIAVGLFIGMFLNWQLIAKKLRVETEKYNCNTLSAFFEKRFNDSTGHLRFLTAAMLVFFMSFYLCAGLIAMGLLMESIFGIDYYWGLSFAALVVMAYTFAGGFITVAWTDLFQALFLIVMIALVPLTAYYSLPNGMETIKEAASSAHISLNPLADHSPIAILDIVFLILGWGLGYFGQPHIVTKFMGIKDPNDLRKSKYLGMTWQAIALTCAIFVGLVGLGYYSQGLDKPELLFVEMVKGLYHPFWSGLILCAIIAANMSTMDSQILVCSSVLSEDLYGKWNPKATQKMLLRVTRGCVILITLIALIVAFFRSSTVMDTVFFAWTGLGCSFGPVMLAALYFPKANKQGAFAGIFVGGIIAALWEIIYPYAELDIPAMIPGFLGSFIAIIAVSQLFDSKKKAVEV